MRNLFRRIAAGFGNLSGRERVLVSVSVALLLLAILYVGVVLPVLGAGDRSEQRLEAAQQQLEAMKRLRRDYDDVAQRLATVEQRIGRGSRGSLRTTLESLAPPTVKVESMEPQASPANDQYRETKVEVGLKNVTLAQAVAYLHQIETAPQVLSVKSLRMRTRADKPDLMDVTFTVSAFERL